MLALLKPTKQERTVPAHQVGITLEESAYALNIAGVYQDRVTREWALQMCRPAARVAGEERIQHTWYEVHRLNDPEVLLEAVRAALRADVIVVSVHAADELPLDLYVWIDAWLPRRLSRVGALAALIGVAAQPGCQAVRTHEYLQEVALRGQLDFVPYERKLPSSVSSTRLIVERAEGSE